MVLVYFSYNTSERSSEPTNYEQVASEPLFCFIETAGRDDKDFSTNFQTFSSWTEAK